MTQTNNPQPVCAGTEIVIKRSGPKSAPHLASIQEESWKEHLDNAGKDHLSPPPMPLAAREKFWKEQLLLDSGKELTVFQAEKGESVIGFTAVKTIRRHNWATIEVLCISPQHRRKYFGRELVRHWFDHLRELGFEKIFVWVLESDANTRNFYESNGFKLDGGYREYPKTPREVRYVAAVQPW